MQLSEDKIKEIYTCVYNKYKDTHANRFRHIEGVCKMASLLAQKYNVSVDDAVISALLHDYYKYETIEEMRLYLDDEKLIEECDKYPFLYHAYCSAKAAKEKFHIENNDIINAIFNHVFGRTNMSLLEEIIMISDYTEENRQYESCVKCREILLTKGINEAIYYSLLKTKEHIENLGEKLHPIQEKVLKEYEEKVMLKTIINSLDKVKATDIVIYDMKGYSPLFDYILISTVGSSRQSDAATSYLKEDLEASGFDVRNIEGKSTAWVLVDCHEVLVHVFTKEEREYFSLEKMYMDIPTVSIDELRK